MSLEQIKEKIVLDFKLDKETTQILMEGDIIVPDVKPDMAIILKTDSDVSFDRIDVSQDRVNFVGKLDIQMLYQAKGSDKPIHSIHTTTPIDDFLNIDGVTKDMWVDISGEISNIDYKVLNDRKVSYRAVINVFICAEGKNEEDVIINISDLPKTQLLQKNIQISRNIEKKEEHFIVKDELSIPNGKPNISELLQYNVVIANKDVKVSGGKVSINGELLISTLYKGDMAESVIEFVEHEIPFNGAIEMQEASEGMFADVTLGVKDKYVQVRPDSDGEDRMLEAEISIGAIVRLSKQDEISVLEDAYAINKKITFSRSTVKYPRLICRNRNQTPVKEVVQLTGSSPNMLQIFRVTGKVHLDEVKVIEDKVIAEGIIGADILYIAESDATPLYCYQTILPFRQTIETKGALPEMDVSIETSIDHTGFNMLSDKEVELRFLLSFNTRVIEEKEINLIADLACEDMDRHELDRMPGMIVYVVQKGDALWKIAKKYNTSIDELLTINEIENPDKVYQGQKLLILKKISER